VLLDSILGCQRRHGIDLGTCNTSCASRERHRPQRTSWWPSASTSQVLRNGNAVGRVARKCSDARPVHSGHPPLKDGVIADFDITEAMLSYFIRKVHGRSR